MLGLKQPLKRVERRNSGNRGYTFLSSNKLTNNRIPSADPSTSFDPSRCEIKANLHRPQRSLQWGKVLERAMRSCQNCGAQWQTTKGKWNVWSLRKKTLEICFTSLLTTISKSSFFNITFLAPKYSSNACENIKLSGTESWKHLSIAHEALNKLKCGQHIDSFEVLSRTSRVPTVLR